jgi:hypothetical protein
MDLIILVILMLFADSFLVTLNKYIVTARNNSVRIKFNKSSYQGGQYATEFMLIVWYAHLAVSLQNSFQLESQFKFPEKSMLSECWLLLFGLLK